MRIIQLFLVILFCSVYNTAQNKSDMESVNKLLDKYLETEVAGDMISQFKLMTDDRVYIGSDGRTTNQKLNMEYQKEGIDKEKKVVPGIKYFIDDRDRLIKFYNDVCIVSFYRFTNVILPVGTPPEISKSYATPIQPIVITLVLVKEHNDWKIVHTHVSLLSSSKQ